MHKAVLAWRPSHQFELNDTLSKKLTIAETTVRSCIGKKRKIVRRVRHSFEDNSRQADSNVRMFSSQQPDIWSWQGNKQINKRTSARIRLVPRTPARTLQPH